MLILLWLSMFIHWSIFAIIRYNNWLACIIVNFPTKTKTVIVKGISLIRVYRKVNEICVISIEISPGLGRNRENVNEVERTVGKSIETGNMKQEIIAFPSSPSLLISKTRV